MKRFMAVSAFITLTIFVTVVVLGTNAHARKRTKHRTGTQSTGFYIGANAGLNILDDSTLVNAFPIDIKYDPGFLVGGVLGYDFGMVRLDAEFAYRTNDASDLILPAPLGGFPAEGSTSALSYMINGYFDIPTSMSLKPYLGVGIGYSTVSLEIIEPSFFGTLANDSDSVLVYQFSAGIGYEISRTTTLSLGYRYFATDDLEMTTIGAVPFTIEYQSHEFNIGVRFLFN